MPWKAAPTGLQSMLRKCSESLSSLASASVYPHDGPCLEGGGIECASSKAGPQVSRVLHFIPQKSSRKSHHLPSCQLGPIFYPGEQEKDLPYTLPGTVTAGLLATKSFPPHVGQKVLSVSVFSSKPKVSMGHGWVEGLLCEAGRARDGHNI